MWQHRVLRDQSIAVGPETFHLDSEGRIDRLPGEAGVQARFIKAKNWLPCKEGEWTPRELPMLTERRDPPSAAEFVKMTGLPYPICDAMAKVEQAFADNDYEPYGPKSRFQQAAKTEEADRRRAREEDGAFKADDPAEDKNEAWEGDSLPDAAEGADKAPAPVSEQGQEAEAKEPETKFKSEPFTGGDEAKPATKKPGRRKKK